MMSIVIKNRNTKEENRVEMSFKEFFENSPQFNGLSLEKAHEHFYYSPIESDHLILSLNARDFTINFSNLPLRNFFNLNYELSEGKNIFDIYTSFKLIGFEEILSNLEVGGSKKFDYFIFDGSEVIHFYFISVYKDINSILFTSSRNISYEMFTNKKRSLNSFDDEIIITENNFKNQNDLQNISKIVNYKNKYEKTKSIKSLPLKTIYNNTNALSQFIISLIEREYKESNDSLEILEKTQNRIRAIQIASKMLSNSSKFKINLKTFFDKYIRSIHKFYDINHVDLDWEISREFVDSKLIFVIAFTVNEILAEILKYTSPQIIETIRFNIFKDGSDIEEESSIILSAWTDLIFYKEEDIDKEFDILKYILKRYNFNNYKIEVNDEGTFFNIKFNY